MALVGVIAKELTDDDYERASRGLISGDLGGGEFGAKNVPRGFPNPEGGHGGGRGRVQPTDKFFERKRGGADVPAHTMERENTGQSPIPHPASHESLLEAEADGPESEADFHERKDRLMESAMQGGRGLAGAMRRQGVNSREFYPGTGNNVQGGINPGVKHGVKTAQIPGRIESAPYEHKHAELKPDQDPDDVLDGLAESHEARERSKTTGQDNQQLSAGATTPNQEQRRDQPTGSGGRREEN